MCKFTTTIARRGSGMGHIQFFKIWKYFRSEVSIFNKLHLFSPFVPTFNLIDLINWKLIEFIFGTHKKRIWPSFIQRSQDYVSAYHSFPLYCVMPLGCGFYTIELIGPFLWVGRSRVHSTQNIKNERNPCMNYIFLDFFQIYPNLRLLTHFSYFKLWWAYSYEINSFLLHI